MMRMAVIVVQGLSRSVLSNSMRIYRQPLIRNVGNAQMDRENLVVVLFLKTQTIYSVRKIHDPVVLVNPRKYILY